MARSYTLKRRAEQMAETRRRIVEAAVDLHGSVGPAATTVSMVAERAGVQRHTFYAHFPDEGSLLEACSGMALDRDPPPDGTAWAAIADPRVRLETGLRAIYGWYGRNAALLGCVLRDAEFHAPTREIVTLRMGPHMAAYAEGLGQEFSAAQRALLVVALGFYAWRTLALDAGLDGPAAAALMAEAVTGIGNR